MILSIAILAVTLSIDALFAGFSYGLDGTKIPLPSKLIICAFSVIYAAIALLAGHALANVLPPFVGRLIGALVLSALGIAMIVKAFLKPRDKAVEINEVKTQNEPRTMFSWMIKSLGITVQILKNNPDAGDIDCSGIIDVKEALLLGFALSVDSLGAGIGSAMAGLVSWYIPLTVGLCQLAFLSGGLAAGAVLARKKRALPKKYDSVTAVIPGILLIGLSILRLI